MYVLWISTNFPEKNVETVASIRIVTLIVELKFFIPYVKKILISKMKKQN